MCGYTGAGTPGSMNRDDLVRRFERWVDDALAAEESPDGIDGEMLTALTDAPVDATGERDHPRDSYTLWAAMTALTHEVKLQGRAFKELRTTLDTQVGPTAEEVRAASRERERRSRREMLSAVIDVRDILARGLESVRAVDRDSSTRAGQRQRWLARVFTTAVPDPDPHTDTLVALTTGYELGLERLDQTLDGLNAKPIHCDGQRFDPRRMNAVDREESSVVPEGTVLEVYRTGYQWGDEVFRPAQVKVACAPAGPRHE